MEGAIQKRIYITFIDSINVSQKFSTHREENLLYN